jgi:hypothetical protein
MTERYAIRPYIQIWRWQQMRRANRRKQSIMMGTVTVKSKE